MSETIGDQNASSILARFRSGQVLDDVFIFDVHAHIDHIASQHRPARDTHSLVRALRRVGVNRCCISSILSLYGGDVRAGNRRTAAAVREHPDLLMGYFVLDPRDPAGMDAEVRTWLEDEKGIMCGIKLYPLIHEYPLNDERYGRIFAVANEHRLPMLIHTWDDEHQGRLCSPALLNDVVGNYPDATFILGHAGGTLTGFRVAVEVAARHTNAYLELCASRGSLGQIEFFVEQVGAGQILYGSDVQFLDVFSQIAKVVYARISEDQKRSILGLNAARIFGVSANAGVCGDDRTQSNVIPT